MTIAAIVLGVAQLPFAINLAISSQLLCRLGEQGMRGEFAVLTEEESQRWLARETALTALDLRP